MPLDLLDIVPKSRMADVPIHERDPADIETEVIPAGPFEMKAYFLLFDGRKPWSLSISLEVSPRSFFIVTELTLTGICKNDINKDRSWCLNVLEGLLIAPLSMYLLILMSRIQINLH